MDDADVVNLCGEDCYEDDVVDLCNEEIYEEYSLCEESQDEGNIPGNNQDTELTDTIIDISSDEEPEHIDEESEHDGSGAEQQEEKTNTAKGKLNLMIDTNNLEQQNRINGNKVSQKKECPVMNLSSYSASTRPETFPFFKHKTPKGKVTTIGIGRKRSIALLKAAHKLSGNSSTKSKKIKQINSVIDKKRKIVLSNKGSSVRRSNYAGGTSFGRYDNEMDYNQGMGVQVFSSGFQNDADEDDYNF